MKFGWRHVAGSALLSIIFCCLVPVLLFGAESFGTVRGAVYDTNGLPVAGAFVTVTGAGPMLPERTVITERSGSFFIPNLRVGDYSVRINMSRYHPVLQNGIHLAAGAVATLTVKLETSMDVVRRAESRDAKDAQNIVWVLRSSRSTQPVLRLLDPRVNDPAAPATSPDYSGYVQVYSRSVETAGGTTDSMGSHFSVTVPLQSHSKVTVAGQYDETPTQPRGVSAQYEFRPAERRHSSVGLNARQGVSLFDGGALREVQLEYKERLESFDHFVLDYGAEAGRADQASQAATYNYLRPRLGVSWIPDSRTVVGVSATSQAPARGDDPIRGNNYFNQVYLPPALEHYMHTEISASRFLNDDTKVSVAVFRDRVDNHSLFVSSPEGRVGLMIVDGRSMPSQGVRVHVNKDFWGVDAGLGYTAASGIGVSKDAASFDEVRGSLTRRNFHVVTARLKTDLDATNTEFTAVYRWSSEFAAAPIDPYQSLVEYNDPTLSITIAQNLPQLRTFPGKIQAILDARNLLEPTFGPRKAQLTPSPRLVKGGINIRF